MKYLKTYEKQALETIILYEAPKFLITYNENDCFTYVYKTIGEKSAILAMADLIRRESKYLNDEKLRNIEIRKKDIEFEDDLDDLSAERIKNIKEYRSSRINHFINNKNIIRTIPTSAYIDLTIKYYPIISNAIKESKTLGDVIDKFKIIYEKFNKSIELYINVGKYNI
jgi:hypothetical protein